MVARIKEAPLTLADGTQSRQQQQRRPSDAASSTHDKKTAAQNQLRKMLRILRMFDDPLACDPLGEHRKIKILRLRAASPAGE